MADLWIEDTSQELFAAASRSWTESNQRIARYIVEDTPTRINPRWICIKVSLYGRTLFHGSVYL